MVAYVFFAFVCILFTCHISHLHLVVVFCGVLECLVICFLNIVQKRPHLQVGVLGLARGSPLKALMFSFSFSTIGETTAMIGDQTAE